MPRTPKPKRKIAEVEPDDAPSDPSKQSRYYDPISGLSYEPLSGIDCLTRQGLSSALTASLATIDDSLTYAGLKDELAKRIIKLLPMAYNIKDNLTDYTRNRGDEEQAKLFIANREMFEKVANTYAKSISTGRKTNQGVRGVLNMFFERIEKLNTQYLLAQKMLELEINFAHRRIVSGKEEQAGDGTCYIHFAGIGMGDFTLVATPSGRRIMIDCGTAAATDADLVDVANMMRGAAAQDDMQDDDVKVIKGINNAILSIAKSKTFLNGNQSIDLLFLTHPDKDHYNRLKPAIDKAGITIGAVYYGGAENISAYSDATTSTFLETAKAVLNRVVIREEETRSQNKKIVVTRQLEVGRDLDIKTLAAAPGKANVLASEYIDPVTKALVIYYETDSKTNATIFKISVLCGNMKGVWQKNTFIKTENNIATSADSVDCSTLQNRGSLVVCIECYDQVILVCGDATAITERFLVKYYADTVLNKVTCLRAAHHGSPTSSSKEFLNALTALTKAVISTGGEKTKAHGLPKKRVITKYIGNAQLLKHPTDAHGIYCFEDNAKKAVSWPDIKLPLFTTGSNGTHTLRIQKPKAPVSQ